MEIDLFPARSVRAHRLVAIGGEEQVAMIRGDDRVLDAGRRQLANRARQVVDDRVHHLPGLEREARLAGVVDLLRANDDDLGAIDLLRELRWLEAQKLVERDVDQLRHARRRELLPSCEVGQKRVVDARAELAALLDDAEAADAPG